MVCLIERVNLLIGAYAQKTDSAISPIRKNPNDMTERNGRRKMDRQELLEWAKETYGTEPDYPWNDGNCVLRHENNRKWYALVMKLNEKKLGQKGDRIVDVLNVKCDPLLIGSLRTQPGYFPAYHMNKDRWLSIILDGTVSPDEIKDLVKLSHQLTKK